MIRLNLASGFQPKKDHINIDNNPLCNPDRLHDIKYGLPYADDSVDEISCEHYIEHLDGEEFIRFFNFCHRVLKEGGILHLKAPYYKEKWAWIDPTHKRPISEHSFDFFINHDYNSVNAGVKGWWSPGDMNIKGGEISLSMIKLKRPDSEVSI